MTVDTVTAPDPVKNPVSAWNYLHARKQVIAEEAKGRPLLRVWDKRMRYIGTVHTDKSCDAEQLLHDTGTGEIVLRGSDWLVKFLRTDVRAEEDLNLTIDPYPHRRNWRWRFGFKVTNVKTGRSETGLKTVILQIAENREHWKHILFGATPFLPPEAQPIKCWLQGGNTRTIVSSAGSINLARLFNPVGALIGNALNPGAWVGASNLLNFDPLNWPLQMQFVNPLFDQSRLGALMSRWQNAHEVTESLLKDAGCHIRVYTWLEEDTDSPHPELAAIVGEAAARPKRNCYVIACEDSSGVTGPTGTFIDGAINLLAATGDDLITTTLFPEYDENGDGVTDPLIRKWFGVAPAVPDITFRDGDQSAIISSEHSIYKSKAKHIMTGGRSPGWVNQVQTFFIKFALSELSALISQGPFAAQVPGTSGLEEVYQGQADNMLLAFMRYTDPNREIAASEYGLLEEFVQGSGSAYTISTPLTLREGHFKTRPHHAFKVSVRNGAPHRLFYDYDLGQRALFEIDGILSTDQISAIRLRYDENTPKTIDLSIGDDTESQSPTAQVARNAQEFWSGMAMLFGSENLF